jgi:PAS domain-containing protein
MATKQPIEAGVIAQAAGRLGAAVRGTVNAWFGPSEPMTPMVTGAEQADSVRGRQFDYQVAFNRTTTPRNTEATSFIQLRQLADACDVLRLVIETRKDQMAKMKWIIKPTDETKERDTRCDELQALLRFPDREHDWDTWLRMLLEEMLVTDAAALYIRKTLGGGVYAIEPLDGATIKRVLDARGRTPMAPDAAFQQVLKGIPAINYSTDELIYRPRNQRVWKVYGYSPVEQILLTVNTALRRSVHVMQSYTEGNIPEALQGVPETWTMAQIAEYQTYWDSLMEGDTAARRHMKFIPGGLKYQATKEPVLKDEFDEWLARVVCFAFSIPPTPFIKSNNRATAESSQEAAISEGLAPVMQWVKNLLDFIIQRHMGFADLEFDWHEEEAQDPLVVAQINKIYLEGGVLTVDEVRMDLGMEPLTPEQLAAIAAAKPAPPQPFGEPPPDDDPEPPPGEEAAKVAKAAKKPQPGRIDPDRATVVKLEKKLAKKIAAFLADQLAAAVGAISKADGPSEEAKVIIAALNVNWTDLSDAVQATLEEIAKTGAADALAQVGSEIDVTVYGPKVSEWAAQRAAELVGMKKVDGEWIENPNAEWVISDSTRDTVQALVTRATDEGLTMDELADLLTESGAFSEDRAMMIARTETRLADSAGQMEGYVASGVVEGTEWSTSMDDLVDVEICEKNSDAGMVPLGQAYPSGDVAPPGHPNCRCVLVASLIPTDDN